MNDGIAWQKSCTYHALLEVSILETDRHLHTKHRKGNSQIVGFRKDMTMLNKAQCQTSNLFSLLDFYSLLTAQPGRVQ